MSTEGGGYKLPLSQFYSVTKCGISLEVSHICTRFVHENCSALGAERRYICGFVIL